MVGTNRLVPISPNPPSKYCAIQVGNARTNKQTPSHMPVRQHACTCWTCCGKGPKEFSIREQGIGAQRRLVRLRAVLLACLFLRTCVWGERNVSCLSFGSCDASIYVNRKIVRVSVTLSWITNPKLFLFFIILLIRYNNTHTSKNQFHQIPVK